MNLMEASGSTESSERVRAMSRLVAAVQELSLARNLETVIRIVRTVAREISGADGATFILRERDQCHYVDEDAIGPLWKGQRFPLSACVSGWAMLHCRPVVIPDIFDDPRVPVDAYRPTFVKSLVMVPIRTEQPIGAIGTYWARQYNAAPHEVELLQALANVTSVALENIRVYDELEQRVQARTSELQAANEALEAFSYSVSHDLRSPLTAISGYAELARTTTPLDREVDEYVGIICSEVARMNRLIDDLLAMASGDRAALCQEVVDLRLLAATSVARLRETHPGRHVNILIGEDLQARGDRSLLGIVVENLLSNAWKYTSKRERATVEVGRSERGENHDTFFVRDNGAGFDMAHARQLFVPFKRLHSRDDYPGTGVGLATVRRIIERHGGTIWAQAAPGEGAAFFFTLPH